MKKQILNLGKALNKAEQKEVNGGRSEEWCDTMEGFWGLNFNTGEWCCTLADFNGVIRSYC